MVLGAGWRRRDSIAFVEGVVGDAVPELCQLPALNSRLHVCNQQKIVDKKENTSEERTK